VAWSETAAGRQAKAVRWSSTSTTVLMSLVVFECGDCTHFRQRNVRQEQRSSGTGRNGVPLKAKISVLPVRAAAKFSCTGCLNRSVMRWWQPRTHLMINSQSGETALIYGGTRRPCAVARSADAPLRSCAGPRQREALLVGDERVEKLLRHGEGWLELILTEQSRAVSEVRRSLADEALARLLAERFPTRMQRKKLTVTRKKRSSDR